MHRPMHQKPFLRNIFLLVCNAHTTRWNGLSYSAIGIRAYAFQSIFIVFICFHRIIVDHNMSLQDIMHIISYDIGASLPCEGLEVIEFQPSGAAGIFFRMISFVFWLCLKTFPRRAKQNTSAEVRPRRLEEMGSLRRGAR